MKRWCLCQSVALLQYNKALSKVCCPNQCQVVSVIQLLPSTSKVGKMSLYVFMIKYLT